MPSTSSHRILLQLTLHRQELRHKLLIFLLLPQVRRTGNSRRFQAKRSSAATFHPLATRRGSPPPARSKTPPELIFMSPIPAETSSSAIRLRPTAFPARSRTASPLLAPVLWVWRLIQAVNTSILQTPGQAASAATPSVPAANRCHPPSLQPPRPEPAQIASRSSLPTVSTFTLRDSSATRSPAKKFFQRMAA